jgi:hypothetical protein
VIPEFPPDSFPGWIIWVGLAAVAIGVAAVVSIPVGYGVRGVHRFVKRRAARKADPEKDARQ